MYNSNMDSAQDQYRDQCLRPWSWVEEVEFIISYPFQVPHGIYKVNLFAAIFHFYFMKKMCSKIINWGNIYSRVKIFEDISD